MAVEQRQLCGHRRHDRWRCRPTEALSLSDAGHGGCTTQRRSGDGPVRLHLGVESSRQFAVGALPTRLTWNAQRGSHGMLGQTPTGPIDGQQLFEEAADLAPAIDEVDLQNPMARPAVRVGLAQWDRVAVPYPQVIGILRATLVRE